MKDFNVNISDFCLGEVSKYTNKYNIKNLYYSSALTLKNMMVSPWQFLIRRSGSQFINSITDSKEVRIIAFEDNNNSILMEIYPNIIRFYINGKPIIKNGEHYYITNNWASEDQIAKLNSVYDDILKCYYFFSLERTPSVLSFDEDYNFFLEDIQYTDGPYLDINKSSTTLSLSGLNGEVQITASADIFKSNDAILNMGRFVRIAHNGIWGVAQITQFIDAKNVKATVKVPFVSTNSSSNFKLGAWGGDQGYPSLATIFNGRMYYGVTNKNKKTIWISKFGDYTNMSPTTRVTEEEVVSDIIAEDNSITLSIPKGKHILWLNSNKDNVLVGSQEGIFTLLPVNTEENISPYNYTVQEINSQKNSKYAVSTDFLTFYTD